MIILGPAQTYLWLGIQTLALLTVANVSVIALSEHFNSRTRAWLIPISGAVFLAATLLTIRTVFLLPFFMLVVHLLARRSQVSKWKSPLSWFPLLLAAGWVAALGIRFLTDGPLVLAEAAPWLRPSLGYRWLANIFWLLIVWACLPFLIPDKWAKRVAAFQNPTCRHLILGLALWLLLVAVLFRWIFPGQQVLGLFLLWQGLLFLILAVALFAVNSTRPKADGLTLAAALLVLVTLFLMQPESHPLGNPKTSWLQPALEHVGPQDVLFIDEDPFGLWPFWVPLDVAGRGQVQLFSDPEHLLQALGAGQNEWARSHKKIWVLLPGASPGPWFAKYRDPQGQPLEVGKSGSRLSLYSFESGFIPQPLLLWENSKPQDLVQDVHGIHSDQIWTQAEFQISIGPVVQPISGIDLYLRGWRPTEAGNLEQELVVTLNGQPLPLARSQSTWFSWDVPRDLDLTRGSTLAIKAPTFVPQQWDPASQDSRPLGLDLDRIILRSP